MDDSTPTSIQATARRRRTVRDFSRRNCVLLFLVLLLIPSLYVLWYLISMSSGSIVPSPDLGIPQAGAERGLQLPYYWKVLSTAWRGTISLVPYSIGQYLLGLQCELDQWFLWASGSLLSIAILTLVEVFDILLNPELQTGGKIVWSVLMLGFSVLGLPVPHLIYWFQYMWTEAEREPGVDGSGSISPSAA